jgi:hypothetical protein
VKEALKDAVAVAKAARIVEVEKYCSRRESRPEIGNDPRTRATHPYCDMASLKKFTVVPIVITPIITIEIEMMRNAAAAGLGNGKELNDRDRLL